MDIKNNDLPKHSTTARSTASPTRGNNSWLVKILVSTVGLGASAAVVAQDNSLPTTQTDAPQAYESASQPNSYDDGSFDSTDPSPDDGHAESVSKLQETIDASVGEEDSTSLAVIPVPSANEPPPVIQSAARVQPSGSLLEEIVVTAQKREEQIQDVPIAISAFTADQLATAGIEDTKALSLLTPGLQFTDTVGFSVIYLRGIGTDAFIPSFDPSVATYVDGIYVPAGQSSFNSLGGVKRVEVLKGPQGTLFGRNSTGGAISITTKDPERTTELEVGGELARFDRRKVNVYANLPIADTLSINAAGFITGQDPYYQLVDSYALYGEQSYSLQRDKSRAGRIKLRWTPFENLDVVVGGFKLISSGNTALIAPLSKPSPLSNLLGLHAEDAYDNSSNIRPYGAVNQTFYNGNATLNTDWFDIKLLGGKLDIDTNGGAYDYDGTQAPLVSFTSTVNYSHSQSAELQILSNDTSWGSSWFSWVAGIYYYHSTAGWDPLTFEVARTGETDNGSLLLGLIPSSVADQLGLHDLLDIVPIEIPALTGPGVQIQSHGILETNSYSAYLQPTFNITDSLRLTIGGRIQKEDRNLVKQYVGFQSIQGGSTTLLKFNKPKVKDHNFSPKVSIDFRPIDEILLYASFSQGYKSGSYNVISIYTPPGYVEAEKATAYEIGAKSDLFGGNLRINAAVFQTKVDNLQQQYTSLLNGGAVSVENAGLGRSRGIEFDFVARPLPSLNSGLIINGGGAYLDAVFLDYEGGAGYGEATGIFRNNLDFTGNRIARVPKWSGNLGIEQTVYTSTGVLSMGLTGYYNSGYFFTAQNTKSASQGSYVLLNGRVSFLYEPWNLKVTTFADNITDRHYITSSFTNDFGVDNTLAPPRTYGVRFKWSLN